MLEQILKPEQLIPTDKVRKFKTFINLIKLYINGKENDIDPIFVIPYNEDQNKYFVCDGNHRGAAAYIAERLLDCVILTNNDDLKLLEEGMISNIDTLDELHYQCLQESQNRHYLEKGWEEYLRDIAVISNNYD